MNGLTILDFSPTGLVSLDERFMYERFKDRTVPQALEMLLENPEAYVDDLGYMGLNAFEYFLPAFLDFLRVQPPSEAMEVGMYLVTKRHIGFGEEMEYFEQTKRLIESIESSIPFETFEASACTRQARMYHKIRDFYATNQGSQARQHGVRFNYPGERK